MEEVQEAANSALQALLKEAALDDVASDWATMGAGGESTYVTHTGSAAAAHEVGDLPPQAMARVCAARLRTAAEEVASLHALVQEKDQRLAVLEKEVQALRVEMVAAAKERKAMEAKAERAQRASAAATEQLRHKEALLAGVEQERRASQQERKAVEGEVKTRESKLTSALAEAARYRKLLEEAREAQRARQDVPREEHGRVLAENRSLQGQKQELVAAFSKAMKLVGVLEQQKVHLQAGLTLLGGAPGSGA